MQINNNELPSVLDYISFVEILTRKFAQGQSKETVTALLFIGFDDLARFNGTFGFHIDEDLMMKISSNIGLLLSHKDALARAGAHELLIMHDLSLNEDPEMLAKRIVHLFSEPCVINEHMFYIQATIGISLYPLDDRDAPGLIKTSKETMEYTQKESKKNIGMAQDIVKPKPHEKTIRLMSDLPAAIENGDIYFLYQGQYSYDKECFVGAELLARWKHPEYGEISPGIFIPIAEQIGMIGSLTIKAFDAASKTFSLLEQQGIKSFSLSINVSPVFLTANNFDETIDFLVEQYDLSGKQLNFEITEEILLKQSEALMKSLTKIKSYNIGIELDDFGTGYTSLQHLVYFPIDTLKVDKSFADAIDKDERKRTLFYAIVKMAGALNIKVIAEGIENSSQDRIARALDSMTVQGYFYSKPVKIDQLIETFQEDEYP